MSTPDRHSPPPPAGGHIIIIGGGATGALTAVGLAEAGFQVTIVEMGTPGNGSSSRSAAAIRAQFGVPETVLGMLYSEEWYRHLHDHLSTPEDQRGEVVFRQNGYLFLYEDETTVAAWDLKKRQQLRDSWAAAQKNAAMQQSLGLPVEVLTPEQVLQRWPHLTGDYAYGLVGATWCPNDGFLVPDLVYNHGIRRAKELGVKVMLNTKVIGSQVVGGKIVGLIVEAEDVIRVVGCHGVVNCTNAWAARVSTAIGGMPLPITPLKRYLGFVPRPPAFAQEDWARLPFTIYGMGPGRVCYSRPDGAQLMMGWAHDALPAKGFGNGDQDLIEPGFGPRDRSNGAPYVEAMRRQVADFAPGLVENPVESATCGFYGDTPDHNPLIGPDTRLGGLYHCAGFSGHGLMHAPISALLIRAMVAGEVEMAWKVTRDSDGKEVKRELRPAVRLPAPHDGHHLFLDAFAPDRDFGNSHAEGAVL